MFVPSWLFLRIAVAAVLKTAMVNVRRPRVPHPVNNEELDWQIIKTIKSSCKRDCHNNFIKCPKNAIGLLLE